MSIQHRLIVVPLILLLILPGADAYDIVGRLDTSGTIVRLISFLLGICGSTYLAAALWRRGEKGSESWKYLSISMIMLIFWNIIMTFTILLDILDFSHTPESNAIIGNTLIILKFLDPVIEVIVFLILLFGLKMIIKTMREQPWTVFSRVDEAEEKDE